MNHKKYPGFPCFVVVMLFVLFCGGCAVFSFTRIQQNWPLQESILAMVQGKTEAEVIALFGPAYISQLELDTGIRSLVYKRFAPKGIPPAVGEKPGSAPETTRFSYAHNPLNPNGMAMCGFTVFFTLGGTAERVKAFEQEQNDCVGMGELPRFTQTEVPR